MILQQNRVSLAASAWFIAFVLALFSVGTFAGAAGEPPIDDRVITLTNNGRILFRGAVVPLERLQATVRAAGVRDALLLRAEKQISIPFVVRVLDALGPLRAGGALDAPGPGYHEQLKRSKP